MKSNYLSKLLIFLCVFLLTKFSYSQVTVTGCTGAGNGSYSTLYDATFAIVAAQPLANITITISGNTTEPVTGATLVAGTWATLQIVPSGGAWTISGAITAGLPLLTLNGADNITIDGLNSGGNSLTLSNTTNSNTAGTSTIKFIADATNNTITNCSILGSGTTALGSTGGNIWFSTCSSTGNDNNTISYCKIGPAGANLPSKGIYANGSTTSSAIANSNITIDNCEIYDFFLVGGSAGIYAVTGNTDWIISNNKLYQTASRAMTGIMSGIYFVNATYGDNIQITGNTIGYANNSGTGTYTLTGTGAFQGIYLAAMSTASTACSINSNIISDISFTSATGAFTGINNATAASSNTINVNSNQIKNINIVTTTGTVVGIFAGAATTLNCKSNTVNSISRNAGGVFYGIQYGIATTVNIETNTISNLNSTSLTSASPFYGIYSAASASTENIIGNNIFNLTSSSTAAQTIIGWYNNTTAGTKTIQNNNIYNLSAPAAGIGTIYGIRLAYGANVEISGNKIYSFSGGSTIYGITVSAGTTTNIFKNKIYDLSSSNANPTVYGLYIWTGTTHNIYNNIIGDLRTTAANAAIPLVGINVAGGTTVNLYYNTVYLNATSSGALFWSSALYTSTATTLKLINNIFVNTSTPNGAGLTSAYRRSSTTLTSYDANSNNNLFYAGTPDANHVIMYDGTISYQTLADYKTLVSLRDAVSFTENPAFLSTTGSNANYLHINTTITTQIESGGVNITGITNDYDLDVRFGNTGYPVQSNVGGKAPDIGADEFDGIPLDLVKPVVTYTVLDNSCGTSNVTLSGVNVTDAIGINISGGTVPRIYYKKNSGSWFSQAGTLTSGNATNSFWSFTIVVSDMGGVTVNDIISYYVICQDAAGNVSSEPLTGLVATNVNTVTTAPTTPNTFTISANLSGTYTVGAGGNFTTLTAAVTAYNTSCLGGAVIFSLIDASYSTSETFPIIINDNINANSTNTLTIKPAVGVSATISGSVDNGELIELNGASYIIFDGSNNGTTTRNLTITNTSTTSPTAISLSSLGVNLGVIYSTIKNCNISTGISAAIGYGISIGSTPGSAGADNDNITIQNNDISVATMSIFANGTTSVSAGGLDNLNINSNTINTNSTIANIGIQVGNALSSSINNNTVSVLTSGDGTPVGISLGTGFVSSTVTRNNITNVSTTNTGGHGGRGITVGTGTATSALTIANNFISGVNGSNNSSFSNSSSIGIAIGTIAESTTLTTTCGGVNLYYNTVNMYGTYNYSNACITTALYVGTGATNLDIKNNIFVNSLDNTNIVGAKNYALYSAAANTAFANINFNDYYVSGLEGVLGFLNTDQSTLPLLKTVTGKDFNSINVAPVFSSNSDLHLVSNSNPSLDNLGTYIAAVTTDIDGITRNVTTPDMGADEFTLSVNDAGVTSLLGTYCPGLQSVQITIKDYGINVLNSVDISWSVNGVAQPPLSLTGLGLANGASTTITLGNYTFLGSTDYTIVAVTSLPNATSDDYTANDSFTSTLFQTGLSGNYTVGSGGDFTTLTEAIATVNAYGLCGATVLSLTDASYSGSETFPITINSLSGSSATNTLTIKPATGVNASVSGSVANDAIIKFNGASNVVIDGSNVVSGSTRNLTITNTSATNPSVIIFGSVGTTAILRSTIKNSILINGSNSSSALIISDINKTAGYFNNLTIQNNSIQKASTGIYVLATVATGNGNGLLITANDLNTSGANSISSTGIYVEGVEGATVSNNNIANISQAGANNITAIWFATGSNSGTISGNIISNLTLTNTGNYAITGIYVNPGASSNIINVTNNNISNLANSGTSTNFAAIKTFSPNTNVNSNIISNLTQNATADFSGIFQTNAVNSTCSNNTVSGLTTSTTGVANGINFQGISTGISISKNKIYNIKNTNSSGATANAILLASTSTTSNITASNNVIYDIASYGFNSTTDKNGYGINIYTGGGYKLYFNSINLATNQTEVTGLPACLIINSAIVTTNSLDIRNNIFAIPSTIGTDRYAIICNASNTVFANINYNDYYTSGSNIGYIALTNIANITDLQIGTGNDVNSINVAPVFIAANDLHLSPLTNCSLNDSGTPSTGITTDYDNETRNITTPDIGADEFTPIQPTITSQPVSTSICENLNTTFSVAASNVNSFQWQVNTGSGYTNITSGPDYSGYTGSTLTLNSGFLSGKDGYKYRCYLINVCSPGINSSEAILTINPLPAAAGTITGTAGVAQGESGVTYSITAITDADDYAWTYNGSNYTFYDETTNNLIIDFASDATGGKLSVSGHNSCGYGSASNMLITVGLVWRSPGYWDPKEPDASQNAIIDYVYDPTSTAYAQGIGNISTVNIDCNDLLINAGKIVEIQPTNYLTVNGNLINNGIITLLSSDEINPAGSLLNYGTITGNGYTNVQRFLTNSEYHYISSPIQNGGNANSSMFTNNSTGYFNANFYYYDETVQLTNPTGFTSNDFNEGWKYAHNGSGASGVNMSVKKGYAYYNDIDLLANFTGITNTGDLFVNGLTLTNNNPVPGPLPDFYDGWNFVGNPYPSTIDWDAVSGTLTNVDNAIYVWDGTQYASYALGVIAGSGNQNNLVAPCQGFFVHVNTNPGNFSFSNSQRTNGTNLFLKNNEKNDLENLINLKLSANGYQDNAVVYFKDQATTNFDTETDAFKLYSSVANVPHIYTFTNNLGVRYSINSLPTDAIDNQEVPIGVYVSNSGTYTINVDKFNFSPETNIVIEDLKNGNKTSLKKDASYTFAYEAGETENRFVLHFNNTSNTVSENINTISVFANQKNIYINNIENQNGTVNVYNVLGQTVLKSDLKTVITTTLYTGIYVIEIITNNQKVVKQIMIN